MNELLKEIEKASLRTTPLGEFAVGDTVNVVTRIKEGDKDREQAFSGQVIGRNRGQGKINAAFTVRRIVDGEGVERSFPEHSPRVVRVEVVRKGSVRRAKLYYLRDRVGKSAKVKERFDDVVVGASNVATPVQKLAKASRGDKPKNKPGAKSTGAKKK